MRRALLAATAILLLSTGAYAKNFPVPDPLRGGCKVDADCMKIDTSCANCCEFDAILKQAQEGYLATRAYACGVQMEQCKCENNGAGLKPTCVEHRCKLTSEKKDQK